MRNATTMLTRIDALRLGDVVSFRGSGKARYRVVRLTERAAGRIEATFRPASADLDDVVAVYQGDELAMVHE